MKPFQNCQRLILSLTCSVALSGCTIAASPGVGGTRAPGSTSSTTATNTRTVTATSTSTSTNTSTNTNTNTATSTGLPEARAIKGNSVSAAQNASVSITYNWVGVPLKKEYAVMVHFLDSNNEMVSIQDDHEPTVSTTKWSGALSYSRTVKIPAGIPVGNYKIVVGLFDPNDWSIEARTKLKPGTGVSDLGYSEYAVGTLVVTKGANLPEKPATPPDVGMPTGGKPGAGDAITSATGYGDDYHPAGYALKFHDEFSENTLNASTWINTYAWGDRTLSGNGEEQCYLERNVSQGRGELVLTAKRETVICPKSNRTMDFTSGMINSMNSFSQTYGYFVMRAKLPKGKGLWPAFWLLPTSGDWPPEIDIFEVLGDDPSKLYATYHWKDAQGEHQMDGQNAKTADLSADYHVFAIDWQPGSLKWYVDGKLVASHTGSDVYNKPMYILGNLGVGGYWPGSPNSATQFPAEMAVDYIRAYSK